MEKYKVVFDSLNWNTPLPGVRYKIYKYKNKQMRLVEYSKEFIEPDWCSKGHIGYVIEGEFTINFNGSIVTYKTGDAIFIPPGKMHKHKATILSDKAIVYLVE
ncbi:MAG: cupin domain-containing protein [Spirochaetales bacterium]|nr:cupin domain-containing protein [Spirochaetales bacterium]